MSHDIYALCPACGAPLFTPYQCIECYNCGSDIYHQFDYPLSLDDDFLIPDFVMDQVLL